MRRGVRRGDACGSEEGEREGGSEWEGGEARRGSECKEVVRVPC